MNDNDDMVTIKIPVESFLQLIGYLEGYELEQNEKIKILIELDKYIDEVY